MVLMRIILKPKTVFLNRIHKSAHKHNKNNVKSKINFIASETIKLDSQH